MAAVKMPDQAFLRECFVYDRAVGSLRWKERPKRHFPTDREWKIFMAQFPGREAGYGLSTGYRLVRVGGAQFLAHRIIWKMETGDEPPEVDHRNGTVDDHRWGLLREASHALNSRNNQRRSEKPWPKGVSRKRKRFVAAIKLNYQKYYLGTFDTPEEAHDAYVRAAMTMHGVWANTSSTPKPRTSSDADGPRKGARGRRRHLQP